MDLIMSH